jgi:hypothetical protein
MFSSGIDFERALIRTFATVSIRSRSERRLDGTEKPMTVSEIFKDAYPEQLMAAMRDEIRRAEREQQHRDAAAQRRRARTAALRARLGLLFGRR